jgi:hypothetical protein
MEFEPRSMTTRTGLHCYNCGEDTLEERLMENGMKFYRCENCIAKADKNEPEPCPRCGCPAHDRTCLTVYTGSIDEGLAKWDMESKNFSRPEFESYTCLNCGYKYYTKAYEKFLASKVIKEVK